MKEEFGFDSFLEGQHESLQVLLEKEESALLVLATGGGKSLVYQYAALFAGRALVVVVTPLISLMTDQLNKLPDCLRGACLNSYQTAKQKSEIMGAVRRGAVDVLYVSPERLVVEDLTTFGRDISFFCVDEVHCATEWSHCFRPSFLKLNEIIFSRFRCRRVLGLTATATKQTENALKELFYFQHVFRCKDLSRINLSLSITR